MSGMGGNFSNQITAPLALFVLQIQTAMLVADCAQIPRTATIADDSQSVLVFFPKAVGLFEINGVVHANSKFLDWLQADRCAG